MRQAGLMGWDITPAAKLDRGINFVELCLGDALCLVLNYVGYLLGGKVMNCWGQLTGRGIDRYVKDLHAFRSHGPLAGRVDQRCEGLLSE